MRFLFFTPIFNSVVLLFAPIFIIDRYVLFIMEYMRIMYLSCTQFVVYLISSLLHFVHLLCFIYFRHHCM